MGMKVPRELMERVMAFQHYVSKIHREDLEQSAFADLSENLLKELRLCQYRKLVIQAPFLREQTKDVVSYIVGELQDQIFMPGDIIVRAGTRGRQLFFMRRGTAAVYMGEASPIWGESNDVATYVAGNCFGELGMITGHPRAAWIMATTYCIVSVLPYSAVENLSKHYPGAFTTLVQNMAKMYNLKSTLSWDAVSRRLQDRGHFESVEDAFEWLCCFNPIQEDFLCATAFEEGMRRMKIPPLDRKVLWAEMDGDNSGMVTLAAFSSKVAFNSACHSLRSSRKVSLGTASLRMIQSD